MNMQEYKMAIDENWNFPSVFEGNFGKFIIVVPFDKLRRDRQIKMEEFINLMLQYEEKRQKEYKENPTLINLLNPPTIHRNTFRSFAETGWDSIPVPTKNGYVCVAYDTKTKNVYFERVAFPMGFENIPLEYKLFVENVFQFGGDKIKSVFTKTMKTEYDARKYYAALSFFSDTIHSFMNDTFVAYDKNGERIHFSYMGIWGSFDRLTNPETISEDNKSEGYGKARKMGVNFFDKFNQTSYYAYSPAIIYGLMTEDFKYYIAKNGTNNIVEKLYDFMGLYIPNEKVKEGEHYKREDLDREDAREKVFWERCVAKDVEK